MPTVFSLFAFHDEAGEEEPACGLHLYFLAKKLAGVPLFTGVAQSRSDYTSHDEEVEVKITKRKELRADLAPASKCQGCIERASIGAIWDTEQVVWDMRTNTEHE